MQLVEKHVINRNHQFWKECDQLAFKSKDLYNAANYIQRQYFFDCGKYHTLTRLYHLIKNHEAYRALPTKVSKQICKVLCQAWTGFVGAMKAWKKDPSKFLGKPKLPGYKHKTDGRNVVIYPDESVSIPGLRNGFVILSQSGIKIPTKTQTVDQVRIVPQKTCYVVEVIYTQEVSEGTTGYSAAIDLGLRNLMTATSNNPAIKPLIVNGKPLKAINQLFNKRKALAQSPEAIRQVLDLVHKRNNRVYNYLHTASRRVIDWCLASGISQLIVGKNDGWKQQINIGKSNNQQFTAIPHARLIQMLEYKGALVGIKVITTEEAYTSKASALDGDALPKYGEPLAVVRQSGLGEAVRCGGFRASAVGGFPDLRRLAFRCSTCRGFPQEELPKGFPGISKVALAQRDRRSSPKGKAVPSFSGKRIKRGLYRSGTGRLINADVNASLNIGRKVIPNFMEGIEGLPFIPVVVDPLRMHLTNSV